MKLVESLCIVLLLMCIAQSRLESIENDLEVDKEIGLTSGDNNDEDSDDEETNATRKTIGDNASADSDDVNPDDEYEDAQVIDDLFKEEKNCRMMFALGVRLINLNKNQCLEQCLETDSCNSVSFNPSVDITDESSSEEVADGEGEVTSVCRLNTETKEEVGPFFKCGSDEAQGWDHYEKLPDYFLIFNKDNGKILKAVDENSVTLTSKSDDSCFWYWSGEQIYSKKYPNRQLTVKLRTHFPMLGMMMPMYRMPDNIRQQFKYLAGLKGKDDALEQKWSNGNDGLLKLKLKDSELVLGIQGGDNVVIGRKQDVYSEYWTLSLERSYFILTNRDSGNVMQTHNTDGSVIMSKYNGDDDQLWFWDDTNIRSRKFPDKVLEVTRGEGTFEYGDANLVTYRSTSNLLQKWEADGEYVRTLKRRRRRSTRTTLCAKTKGTEKGVRVVGCPAQGERNDRWSFSSARVYFFILEKQTGKVIQVDSTNSVSFQHYDASKKQLWFWDQDVIRSKLYTDKVLSVDGHNRVRLSSFHGSNDLETWSYDGTCLISKAGDQKLKYQGSQIVLSATSDQHWSIAVSHDFFTIWNKASGQVLDISQETADRGEKVITWKYHGEDHQRWFWDNRNIRSKKYPGKVLEMKITPSTESSSWLDVQMADFTGELNQQWRHEGKYFVCDRQGRHLSVKEFKPAHSDKMQVGACTNCSDAQKEYFSYSSQAPVYFALIEKQSDKVFSFDVNVRNKLKTETLEKGDQKYWFWEGDSIRSKMDSRYVLTLKKEKNDRNWDWWTLTADTYHDPPIPAIFQSFRYDKGNYLVVPKDGFQFEYRAGKFGGYSIPWRETGNKRIQMAMVDDSPPPRPEDESCIDKTEQSIYSVVEWIPFVSTAWDLFSSIGYGIAGCDSVAQERAISMSIGLVTDVATAATFGAASAPLTALKTGAKVGIKLGVKAGLKATVTVAKTSIKTAFKKTITMGLKQGLKKGLTKAGKFIAKETIIDPAMFLKNIGKVSKQILTRPKKTLAQFWKAGKEGVENLKKLRKKLVDSGENVCKLSGRSHVHKNTTHDAKKRGCFDILLKKDLTDAKKHLIDLVDSPNYWNQALKAAEERYGTLVRNTDRYKLWESQAEKPANREELSPAEKLRLFAVYEYTREPNINQYTRGFFYDGKSEEKWLKQRSKDEIDEIMSQASLINDFLKANKIHHLPGGTIVHRFEPQDHKDIYQVGRKYSDMRVLSATTKDSIEQAVGNAVNLSDRPRHLIMNLKKSGCDVRKFAQVATQKEITLPMGTRFEVMSRKVKNIDGVEVDEINLNEID